MVKCEGAETILRAIIDNDEGAGGAIKRERWLAAQNAGYLEDLADSVTIMKTIVDRVFAAKAGIPC